MDYRYFLIMLLLLVPRSSAGHNTLYQVKASLVTFSSNAPLELIQAGSSRLKGVIDTARGRFAFKIFMASFEGFNNPLQQEHFNENYLETARFPFATYTGKIIEDIDFRIGGHYIVRTKGKMIIHGVARERMISAEIVVTRQQIKISAHFTILLSDHQIKIPRIVGNNLANKIRIEVTADLIPAP